MIIEMFSVFDSKAQAFLPPFYARTDAEAVRMFGQAANQEGHNFHKYAADYTLFGVATFDDATGQVSPYLNLNNLGNAIALIDQPTQQNPLKIVGQE